MEVRSGCVYVCVGIILRLHFYYKSRLLFHLTSIKIPLFFRGGL